MHEYYFEISADISRKDIPKEISHVVNRYLFNDLIIEYISLTSKIYLSSINLFMHFSEDSWSSG